MWVYARSKLNCMSIFVLIYIMTERFGNYSQCKAFDTPVLYLYYKIKSPKKISKLTINFTQKLRKNIKII